MSERSSTESQVTMAILATKLEHVIAEILLLSTHLRVFIRQQALLNEQYRDRIARLESEMRVVKWLGAFAGAIVLALVLATLRNLLGF